MRTYWNCKTNGNLLCSWCFCENALAFSRDKLVLHKIYDMLFASPENHQFFHAVKQISQGRHNPVAYLRDVFIAGAWWYLRDDMFGVRFLLPKFGGTHTGEKTMALIDVVKWNAPHGVYPKGANAGKHAAYEGAIKPALRKEIRNTEIDFEYVSRRTEIMNAYAKIQTTVPRLKASIETSINLLTKNSQTMKITYVVDFDK